MYPPKHHQENNREHLIEVIKKYPLATLISIRGDEPLLTHLPLILKNGKLIGHIDKFNPQTESLKDENPISVIFYGPQCYISPSIYTTTQLPTWNYIRVHLKGRVKAIENKSALKESLITMTEFLEAPDQKYILEPDNPRMERNLDYIKMFEIEITHWEGKFKLSQDKKPKDTELAKDELKRANQENINDFIEQIFR